MTVVVTVEVIEELGVVGEMTVVVTVEVIAELGGEEVVVVWGGRGVTQVGRVVWVMNAVVVVAEVEVYSGIPTSMLSACFFAHFSNASTS